MKLQPIRAGVAQGTSLNMVASSATFIYVNREAVLLHFTGEGRIDDFETQMQLSDWLELSENRCARANAGLAAAQRIH